MAKRKAKSKKRWIQGAIKRPGALKAYAKQHGGVGSDGAIKRSWAQAELRRLSAKKTRTAADTRRMRQLNLFLKVLTKKKR